MALSVSTFMISALIGSTTEPVIRNSTTSVATITIANTSGRWCARLHLRSTKAAVCPPA